METKSKLRRITAGSILAVISSGGVWEVYSALDERVRANEIRSNISKTELSTISSDVKIIREDIKKILERL